jgi:hypothetical protein
MDLTNARNLNPNSSRKLIAKQTIALVLSSKGPTTVANLQRLVRMRRSIFLKALNAMVASEVVRVRGIGIKGRPRVYSLVPTTEGSGQTVLPKKRRLIIV